MSAPRLLVALSFSVLFALACGGGAVSPGTTPTPQPEPAPPPPPSLIDGWFSTAKPAALGQWQEGRTYVIVFSWSEDAAAAAAALRDRRAFAFVSLHTCFGTRALDLGCYAKARAWMQPIVDSGRFLGVYGPDEPLHNGIPVSVATAAVARFKADGYRVMLAETRHRYDVYLRETGTRLDYGADWYGLTAYGDPEEWIDDRYRDDRHLNTAFISDAASSASESATRARMSRFGLRGLLRWSLDMGAARRGHTVVYLQEDGQ